MPIRVIPFDPITGSIVEPLISGFTTTMGPMQGLLNGVAGLGGNVQDLLGRTTTIVDGLAVDPGALLEPQVSINLNNALNGQFNQIVQVAPPRIIGEVQGVVQDVKTVKNNAEQVFNNVKKRTTTTKGIISLALVAVCLLFGSIIQKFIAEMIATALRIERAIIAFIEKIKKAIENFIKETLEAILKALPDCSPYIKKLAKMFKSVLSKVSAVVAKINDFLRKISACFALVDGIMSLFDGEGASILDALPIELHNLARSIGMTGIVERSAQLAKFDAQTARKEFRDGFAEAKETINNERFWEGYDSLVWDETTGQLISILDKVDDIKDKIDDLIDDTNKHPEDDPEYKKLLEEAKKNMELLEKALEESKDHLYDYLKEVIEDMTDAANKGLDDLEKELMEGFDKAEEGIDDIFDKLGVLAEEFDTPEFQEKLVTACMNTDVRVVIED